MRRAQVAGIAAAVAFAIAGAGSAMAQSLTDLDTGSFDKQRSDYNVQSHADPFAKGTSSAEDLTIEDLQLTGIVYRNESESYALISGYLVRPGDKIAGYRVDTIEKDKVRLKRLDEVFILALGGGI